MNHLDEVLQKMEATYQPDPTFGQRNYIEVNIGDEGKKHGFSDVSENFGNVYAVLPIREPIPGMKVRIDGRTFVNYKQFQSGIAVPEFVAEQTNLAHNRYTPNDSMIRNFG